MRKIQDDEGRPFNLDDHLPVGELDREDMIKFYQWTEDDAREAQGIYESDNQDFWKTDVPGAVYWYPLMQWRGAQGIIKLHESYLAGDKAAILKALEICFSYHFPIPRWCREAYGAALVAIELCEAKTWVDIFGHLHPKGTHIEVKRQEKFKSFLVYDRIKKMKKADPSVAIDGCLFESVGKEFGIGGKTTAEKYYYLWKNYFEKGGPFPFPLR
jgi:hypothetical protein